MRPKKHQVLASVGALLISYQSHAEEVVRIFTQEPRNAMEREVRYSGKCASIPFVFTISRERKTIDLAMNVDRIIPLTDSDLGKAILNRPIVGDFSFMCASAHLEIRYFGYSLTASAAPQPVSYFMAIDFSGAMKEDWGWKIEAGEIVYKYFSYPARRQ